MENDKTFKEVKLKHEIINFRCPAKLKMDFDEACGKDERTISQQLRVLMAQNAKPTRRGKSSFKP
jgi:hypothetical protein